MEPHGQKLGSHSTSTSRLMHSSPHPSPVTGSGTHEQIKTSSSVTLFGSRCVKMLRWILCHTLSFTPEPVLPSSKVFFFAFQPPWRPAPPEGKPGTIASPRPCSSASCCALSRMSISSLSISCGASHVSYRESLFSLQNLRREARRVAESAVCGLAFAREEEALRDGTEIARVGARSWWRPGSARGARAARTRRGASIAAIRAERDRSGEGQKAGHRRPARGTRVGRRENVGPRRRKRGEVFGAGMGVRTTARRPPGARRPPSARGATARSGRTAPTRRSTAAGAARPARGSGRPRRLPWRQAKEKVRFFSRSFPDRDLTRATRSNPEVNAIRARSLASTRECGARGSGRGSRSTDDAAAKVHRRVDACTHRQPTLFP